ncbi:MAG: hypothetical protein ACLFQT_11800, partial [Thiohalophilus sp.]
MKHDFTIMTPSGISIDPRAPKIKNYIQCRATRHPGKVAIMPLLNAHLLRILLLLLALIIAGCSKGGGGNSTSTVVVSWDANREAGVNDTDGGYRVYHSTT